MLLKSFVKVGTVKPEHDMADIFREYGDEYRRRYRMTWQQSKVMRAIVNCRTASLGGYVEECERCGLPDRPGVEEESAETPPSKVFGKLL